MTTRIIGVTCKLHSFIIQNPDVIPLHVENDVQGVPDVFIKKVYTWTQVSLEEDRTDELKTGARRLGKN